MVLLAGTERKWLRGKGGGEGKRNASYSREIGLNCVKINLCEIKMQLLSLCGEDVRKRKTVGSLHELQSCPVTHPSEFRVTMERGGFPISSDAFERMDRKLLQ